MFVNHSSNECSKKEVVDIDKKFNSLQLRFSQRPGLHYTTNATTTTQK